MKKQKFWDLKIWNFLLRASNLALNEKFGPKMALNHIDIGLSFHLQKTLGSIDPKMTELWAFLFGQFEIAPIGKFGQKPDLVAEGKTYIYVIQCHFTKIFFLVPNFKHDVNNSRFRVPRIFRFFNFDGPWTRP